MCVATISRKTVYGFIAAALVLIWAPLGMGDILRVDADMPVPGGDGSTWLTAYKYLQNALEDAEYGERKGNAMGNGEGGYSFNEFPESSE